MDTMLKYKILFVVFLQLVMSRLASGLSWPAWFALTYVVGGTLNHSLTLAMHEVSHNLAFHSFQLNKIFGIFVNFPLGIPSFMCVPR